MIKQGSFTKYKQIVYTQHLCFQEMKNRNVPSVVFQKFENYRINIHQGLHILHTRSRRLIISDAGIF